MSVLFSVIIPTYNRRKILLDCLDHLSRQTMDPEAFEVMVCDDGSTDDTVSAVMARSQKYPFCLTVLARENGGPAAARNAGIRHSKGRMVLFLNDDAMAAPDLLAEHMKGLEHVRGENKAMVGSFRFHDKSAGTPFGYIMQYTDALFAYSGLEDGTECGYEHFYSCNVSLPRILLEKETFDPAFKGAAAEDMDLGYRFRKRGVKIYFRKACRCLHAHRISPSDFCRINEMRGHWAALFFAKHPGLKKRPCMTAETLKRWEREIMEEEGQAKESLRHIEAAERGVSGSVLSKHLLAVRAERILPHVNLLHRHHYRRGLVRSPFVSGGVVKEPQPEAYDMEAGRGLNLLPSHQYSGEMG
jgi:glycosyltransferase involved in cell wall biosynthesis